MEVGEEGKSGEFKWLLCDHAKTYGQVESLQKASCKGGSEDGCWSGSGRQSRGEKKKKISGGMLCSEKCREEVEKISLFCCRSSKSREKRLKGWRNTVETEYQRNVVLLSAVVRWNLGTHLSRATSH